MTTANLALHRAKVKEQGGTWVSDHHTARRYLASKAMWAQAHGQSTIMISTRLARALLQEQRTRRSASNETPQEAA